MTWINFFWIILLKHTLYAVCLSGLTDQTTLYIPMNPFIITVTRHIIKGLTLYLIAQQEKNPQSRVSLTVKKDKGCYVVFCLSAALELGNEPLINLGRDRIPLNTKAGRHTCTLLFCFVVFFKLTFLYLKFLWWQIYALNQQLHQRVHQRKRQIC